MSIFDILIKFNEKIIELKKYEESKKNTKEISKIFSLNLEKITENKINENKFNFSRTIFLGSSNVGKSFIMKLILHQEKIENSKNSIDFYENENMIFLNSPNFNKYENFILNFSDLFCNNIILIINDYNLDSIEKVTKINNILNEKNNKNFKKFILIFIDFFNKGEIKNNFDLLLKKITKIEKKEYFYFNPKEKNNFDTFILNLKNSLLKNTENNLSLNEVFNEIKNLTPNENSNEIKNISHDILNPFYSYKIEDNQFIIEIEVPNMENDEIIFNKSENNFKFKAIKNGLKINESMYVKNKDNKNISLKEGEYLLDFNIKKDIKINEKTLEKDYDEDFGILTYSYDLE